MRVCRLFVHLGLAAAEAAPNQQSGSHVEQSVRAGAQLQFILSPTGGRSFTGGMRLMGAGEPGAVTFQPARGHDAAAGGERHDG